MHKLLLGDSAASEIEILNSACKEWGFFQIVNHGVSSSLVENMKIQIKELYKLSLQEKKKLWQRFGDIEGFGQIFVVSEDQKLDWGDMFYIITLPKDIRKLYLYENLPPSFRETLEEYSSELQKLAMTILDMMAKAIGMEWEEIRQLFEDGYQAMRMNYYPPCPQPEKVIGLTPHSDAVGVTILLQVNEAQGLQIRKDGMWVPVKPLPDAFVVNVGDFVEILSNGVYRSVEHRAKVNSVQERLSVATFYSPSLKKEVGPAHYLSGPQIPALFKRITVEEYFRTFYARELKGKSHIETVRIVHERNKGDEPT